MDIKYSHWDEVLNGFGEIYNRIFKNFYPSKGSTGFTERNLSVNFSKAYEKTAEKYGEEAFSWFELPFSENGRKHLDGVIVNVSLKEILLIEAKRYSDPPEKIPEILKDFLRITNTDWEYEFEKDRSGKEAALKAKEYKIFGLVIADVWLETKTKRNIYEFYKKAGSEEEGIPAEEFFDGLYGCVVRSQKRAEGFKTDRAVKIFVEAPIDITQECPVKTVRDTYKPVLFSWKV
ncbi:MAG: hypothetical protein LUD81_08270 [Clostridiales bacterium]|nr:hypothetical protein [Clostridiales bacterium]